MARLIYFNYIGTEFIVQSFLQNDFANICEVNGESFRIDFVNKQVTTSAKETKDWKAKVSQINFDDISKILNSLFYFKYCQSQIEDNGKCNIQCSHCKEYYSPLEIKKGL
jgi:hypothetical protein